METDKTKLFWLGWLEGMRQMLVTQEATSPDGKFIMSVMEPENYFYTGSIIRCLHVENVHGQVLFCHVNHYTNEQFAHGSFGQWGGQLIWIHKAILQEMKFPLDRLLCKG